MFLSRFCIKWAFWSINPLFYISVLHTFCLERVVYRTLILSVLESFMRLIICEMRSCTAFVQHKCKVAPCSIWFWSRSKSKHVLIFKVFLKSRRSDCCIYIWLSWERGFRTSFDAFFQSHFSSSRFVPWLFKVFIAPLMCRTWLQLNFVSVNVSLE